jgi:hypothetical protein
MNDERLKELVIDAIIGAGFPSTQVADGATQAGLARWTGNQWNESWCWKREQLEVEPLADLQELYGKLKGWV